MTGADLYLGGTNEVLPDVNSPASPMAVESHPAYNVPAATESYKGESPRVNRSAKGDMSEKVGNRYGGGDLPTAKPGTNERAFYNSRD